MRRVTFVLDAFGYFGGPERRAFRMASGLKKMGHDVSVISIMKADERVIKKAKEVGIEVFEITNEGNKALKSFRIDVFSRLRRVIGTLDPDIIFTFEFLADYTTKMALLGIDRDIFTFIGSTEWKWERKWHRRIAMRKFVNKSRFYIVNSIRVRDSLLRVLPFAFEKVKVLYNPIDIDEFKPLPEDRRFRKREKLGIGGNDFVVGSVVRFYNPKGANVLIEAFAESAVEAKLLFVGDGSLKGKLKRMVKDLGIEDSVVFAGAMEADAEVYNAFDISVVPSQKGGFDNVVVESMACGVPTVATEATGIGEIAENGRHLVITGKDADSIAQGIKLLYNDSTMASQLSLLGRSLVAERLSLTKICRTLEGWFESA